MRLWHYKLIPYLPKSQLSAQWRELNSIYKKQDKHILINYVYEYPKEDLALYSFKVIKEMEKRGYKISDSSKYNFSSYFIDLEFNIIYLTKRRNKSNVFENHHNNRYLLQCFYNLQEKYDRRQKDFSEEEYLRLKEFVKGELENGEQRDNN